MEIDPKKAKNRSHATKRNRDLLSCKECHRRKQKCDRQLPCEDCLLRGVPHKCAYKPQVSAQKTPRTLSSHITNGRWKRIANGTELILSAESVADLISSSGTDPFNSLPGGLADEPLLVHHYNTLFIKTRHAPGARELWFPMAITDPAFYHSIMMISAANICGLQEKPITPSFWHHRGEAIRHINNRLVRTGSANTDLDIATIAVLCLSDCMEVAMAGVRAHQMALQKLVVVRGGLHKLGIPIQKLLGWTDLMISLALIELPALQQDRLITFDRNIYYGMPSFSTVSYAMDLKRRLFYFTNQTQLSDDLIQIYWGLRNISILTDTECSVDSSTGLFFSDRCEFLEREVQHLLHRSLRLSAEKPESDSLIFTLFARASLIYIYSILRELLVTVTLFQEIGNRIKESLDIGEKDLSILLDAFPDLMLWVLFMGGNTVNLSSKISYVKIAAKILMTTEVNMIKPSANAFLWPEGRENYNSFSLDDTIISEWPGSILSPPDSPIW